MASSLRWFDLVRVSATVERQGVHAPGIAHACARTLWYAWIALLPAALLVFVVQSIRNGHSAWAIDFQGNFRGPAHEILSGRSPYHPGELVRVRAAVRAGHSPIDYRHGVFAAYPAPGLLVGVPFTAIPAVLAAWLWFGCLLVAGGLALWLAGVRDSRVYAAALLTPPVVSSLFYGAVDLVLMLGLAACWRWRDHAGRAGLALGAIVALKLVALPVVVWLLVTRRFGAAAISLVTAAALGLAGWVLIGFDGLAGYPHLLGLLTDIESTRGYSAVAFAVALGAGTGAAAWAPYIAGACLLAALWAVARRPGADGEAFLLGVLAALALSPIVWQHSIALLLVPLAVLRPRFGPIWTAPLLLWLAPDTSTIVAPFKLFLFAVIVAAICGRALMRERGQTPAAGAIA
jgi:glycosyl transferase family 87